MSSGGRPGRAGGFVPSAKREHRGSGGETPRKKSPSRGSLRGDASTWRVPCSSSRASVAGIRPYTRDAARRLAMYGPREWSVTHVRWVLPLSASSSTPLRSLACGPQARARAQARYQSLYPHSVQNLCGVQFAVFLQVGTLIYRRIFTKFGTDTQDGDLRIMAAVPAVSVP